MKKTLLTAIVTATTLLTITTAQAAKPWPWAAHDLVTPVAAEDRSKGIVVDGVEYVATSLRSAGKGCQLVALAQFVPAGARETDDIQTYTVCHSGGKHISTTPHKPVAEGLRPPLLEVVDLKHAIDALAAKAVAEEAQVRGRSGKWELIARPLDWPGVPRAEVSVMQGESCMHITRVLVDPKIEVTK